MCHSTLEMCQKATIQFLSLSPKKILPFIGECVTTVLEEDVCSLISTARECAPHSTTATMCLCAQGYQQRNNLTCVGTDDYKCTSVPAD